MSKERARISPEELAVIDTYTSNVPVKIAALASALGLEVKKATLRPRISGQLQRSSTSVSGYRIRVNRHESTPRQRFTVAHELAHYLLHRDQIGDGIEDSILYRSSLSDAREAEANRLAAELLMPVKTLREHASKFGSRLTAANVQKLADLYQVSEAAMSIRVGLTP